MKTLGIIRIIIRIRIRIRVEAWYRTRIEIGIRAAIRVVRVRLIMSI